MCTKRDNTLGKEPSRKKGEKQEKDKRENTFDWISKKRGIKRVNKGERQSPPSQV